MKKIRKGDTVIVQIGKDKGKTGIVSLISGKKAIVDNLNLVTRHLRPDPQKDITGLYRKPMPIELSNLSLYDPIEKLVGKVKFVVGDLRKDKTRYFKHNNKAVTY